MKKFDDIQTEDQTGCPKRLWVMLTLSDDELVVDEESLPKGLRFHLSRCSSCQALADRLMAVSSRLRDLAQLEPAEEVVIAANGQLQQALHDGARLTGRVKVSDEHDLLRKGTDRGNQRVHRSGPGWYGGAVAAAAVVVAITFWGVWGVANHEGSNGAGVGDPGQAPTGSHGNPCRAWSPRACFSVRERGPPWGHPRSKRSRLAPVSGRRLNRRRGLRMPDPKTNRNLTGVAPAFVRTTAMARQPEGRTPSAYIGRSPFHGGADPLANTQHTLDRFGASISTMDLRQSNVTRR